MADDGAPSNTAVSVWPGVVGGESKVRVLGGATRRYVHLDNAASKPALVAVQDTVNELMPFYASVHRGAGHKSAVSTRAYDDARAIVAQFVGADPEGHVVIFGRSATEAINLLAQRIPFSPSDVVLVSPLEHHSNDLPFRARARVVRIARDAAGGIDRADFECKLAHFRGRVRLVAVTGASNVTGHVPDLAYFAERAHAAGAEILADCAQLAGHRAIRMRELSDPAHLDYVAISGHKLYAPYGSGALIARRDLFEQGAPPYSGGGTVDLVTEAGVHWTSAPARDEAGTPNLIGVVAMARAMQLLHGLGMDAIARHERELMKHLLRGLSSIPKVDVYGAGLREGDRVGVVSFNVAGIPHGRVAAALAHEWGIGVRSGCFCAHPYVLSLLGLAEADAEAAQVAGANRFAAKPGMVRASLGLHNTLGDCDRLIEAVTAIARVAIRGDYVAREGGDHEPAGGQDPQPADFHLGSLS